jgi:hypothetical protein
MTVLAAEVGDFLHMIARPVSFLFRHVLGRFGFF